MRGWRAGLIFVLIVLATGPGLGQEPQASRGGKYALLVGVRKYAPDTLRNLPYTEADVTQLAVVLERSGYPRENITILTQTLGADDPGLLPLGKNLRAQLGIPERPGQPFKRGLKLGPLDEDDTVLIAFAGHGVQFDADGESYFCPMDADLGDEKSLIRLSDVSKALDGCKAGMKLLLVDACRNNPQIQVNRAGERAVVDNPSLSRPFLRKPPGGTLALFSCSAGEVAFEDDEVKHGIFFHHVLRGLNGDNGLDGHGADIDGDGKVDANELAKFAEKNVFLHASRRYRREQTVEVVNRTRGGVAIVERKLVEPPVPRLAREQPKAVDRSAGNGPGRVPDTDFFGLKDSGRSFAYVIDYSGSMTARNSLGVAKRELLTSLDQLATDSRFAVVFYNLDAKVFTDPAGTPGLMAATPANKARVRTLLSTIQPDGGTDHMLALKTAFNLHPEVIFFLTDADLMTRQDVAELVTLAGKTRIQAIEFGQVTGAGGSALLKSLAKATGGSYRYIDVNKFSETKPEIPQSR